jgi:phosphotransferase system enzyme I (PtsI)
VTTLTGVGSTPLSGAGTARWYRPEADLTLPDDPDPAAVDADAELSRF